MATNKRAQPVDPAAHPIYAELRAYLLEEVRKWCVVAGVKRATLAHHCGQSASFFDDLERGAPLYADVVDRVVAYMIEHSVYKVERPSWRQYAPAIVE